jgi:signal transduction histidine kinase
MAALNRALEEHRLFLLNVSYELRTPLTIIAGEAEVALRGADKSAAAYKESLQIIAAQADLMTHQIDDLLFLARSRVGRVHYEMRKMVQLRSLLEPISSQFQLLARARAIQLDADLTHPVRVRGDAARLGELFMNLLDNALKYTSAGGEIRIGLDEVDNWARVVVADTGVGIPARDLPHVFDRFYRRAVHEGQGAVGTGLGLAISHAIVQAHGGQIWAESEEGTGSRFTVLLRCAGTEPC